MRRYTFNFSLFWTPLNFQPDLHRTPFDISPLRWIPLMHSIEIEKVELVQQLTKELDYDPRELCSSHWTRINYVTIFTVCSNGDMKICL